MKEEKKYLLYDDLPPVQEIKVLVWPQAQCRQTFGSNMAADMMCVAKKQAPVDSTCNVSCELTELLQTCSRVTPGEVSSTRTAQTSRRSVG